MKAIVKINFIDKITGKIRNVGDIFTCNKNRFDEIRKAGPYVEEYKEEPEKQDEQ